MILENVPENEVCQNIRNIMAAGWEHITLDKQGNGNWTIRAS
ncbi:hypothetical protein [Nitrosomonas sp.]|nr:hypothetical protein [Nitrosomonas sp.]